MCLSRLKASRSNEVKTLDQASPTQGFLVWNGNTLLEESVPTWGRLQHAVETPRCVQAASLLLW